MATTCSRGADFEIGGKEDVMHCTSAGANGSDDEEAIGKAIHTIHFHAGIAVTCGHLAHTLACLQTCSATTLV